MREVATVTSPVPFRRRLALSVTLGLLAGGMTIRGTIETGRPRDFGQVWYAARALLDGVDPYPLIGPGLAYDWPWPLLYPLPAAIVATPFAPFSEPVASALFIAVGGALFAWALMAHGYGPLFGFFSIAVREASAAGQWSLLLASAFVIPWVSTILVVKPTIGLVMLVARPRWRTIAGGMVLLTLAFLLQPTWLAEWRDAIIRNGVLWGSDRPYRVIATVPGGVLALVALLRWRRPEARLVAALACVPITLTSYEMVPLHLVPRTFWQSAALVGLSFAHHELTRALTPVPWTHAGMTAVAGPLLVALLFLPATLMVLRRPNEGTVPAWLSG